LPYGFGGWGTAFMQARDIFLHRANSEGSMIDHFRDALDRSVRVARQTPRFASRSVAGQAELQ
jgi:hypothetical protein